MGERLRCESGVRAVARDRPAGGIRVRGQIVQSASVVLTVLRGYRTGAAGELLPGYLLGIALGGLPVGGRRYNLRSGCELAPSGFATLQTVGVEGERRAIEVDAKAVLDELRALARERSLAADVELGGKRRVHRFDVAAARKMLRKKPLAV